ncbi:hypothetical protein HPB51_012414 [Rhipicephalus microplus]|uniref:CUB domain-containing protein n=1 Tax=Rhipicephalus microplus TaxID=6941 RepID=A0A9J6E9D2_RHIMP|nr:hypothetical protein HPB51_012414 [Rhipicephalus microplus]
MRLRRCSELVLLLEFLAWFLPSCVDAYRRSLASYDDRVKTTASTWTKNSRCKLLHLLHVVRFPNLMCTGSWGQEGTCYAFQECMERGGTAYGPCAFGFGVCCSLTASCSSMITLNSTYFSSPRFHAAPGATQAPPSGDGGAGGQSSCAVQVFKLSERICQLRLDFDEFDLERPTVGNCDGEKLIVTGHNANNVVPPLCGLNTGQHHETEAGLGVTECTMDYLLLGGVRYCGTKLNPSTEMPNPVVNAPVTDTTSGPFMARFVSDGALNARGFLLNYMQNPC